METMCCIDVKKYKYPSWVGLEQVSRKKEEGNVVLLKKCPDENPSSKSKNTAVILTMLLLFNWAKKVIGLAFICKQKKAFKHELNISAYNSNDIKLSSNKI